MFILFFQIKKYNSQNYFEFQKDENIYLIFQFNASLFPTPKMQPMKSSELKMQFLAN